MMMNAGTHLVPVRQRSMALYRDRVSADNRYRVIKSGSYVWRLRENET